MNSPQSKHFPCMLYTVSLALWVLTGGIAFSQTQAGDTPDPPPAIQEEPSSSPDQGEVVERGIIRRDHRGQPKVLAPPRTTAPGQTAVPPIVRDHRTQQSGASTYTSTSTASLRGASPPLGPPAPTSSVNDIGINFLITNQMRTQIDEIVAQANASAAQQTSVRAKIKVESFKTFGAGLSATQFTDRPNHRFVRIPYMVGYKVYDVKKTHSRVQCLRLCC